METVANNPATSVDRHRDRESVENMVMGEGAEVVVCRYLMDIAVSWKWILGTGDA